MDDTARYAVHEFILKYGEGALQSPVRLKNFLSDLCWSFPLEKNLLVAALEERVPSALLNRSFDRPLGVLVRQLAAQLVHCRGFSAPAAQWAVETWAKVMGVYGEDNTPTFEQVQAEKAAAEREFRELARQAIADGRCSPRVYGRLNRRWRLLGLTLPTAQRIYAEELAKASVSSKAPLAMPRPSAPAASTLSIRAGKTTTPQRE